MDKKISGEIMIRRLGEIKGTKKRKIHRKIRNCRSQFSKILNFVYRVWMQFHLPIQFVLVHKFKERL
jgi:hypothetical protein